MITALANLSLPTQSPLANDAILRDMDEKSDVARWLAEAKARGRAPFLLTLLDVIEPLAPLLASGLLVAQPLAGWWLGAGSLRELAGLLEAPEGLAALRERLAEAPVE